MKNKKAFLKRKEYERLKDNDDESLYSRRKRVNFFQQLFALMKKGFIVRRNTSSSIVSIFILPLIIFSLDEFDLDQKGYLEDIKSPTPAYIQELTNNGSINIFAVPDHLNVKIICKSVPFNKTFFNDINEMLALIDSTANSKNKTKLFFGIQFINYKSPNFFQSPKFSIYTKDADEEQQQSIILSLMKLFSKTNDININISKSFFPNHYIYKAKYAFSSDALVSLMIVIIFITIISSEVNHLLIDKESKVMWLMFINKCTHLNFWISNILLSICSCIPSCLFISFFLTNQEFLVDSDFFIVFVLLIMFALSEIFMMFFISQFMKESNDSRYLKYFFTVFSILFEIFKSHFNHSELITFFFPHISFGKALTSFFIYKRSFEPVKWTNLLSDNYLRLATRNIFDMMKSILVYSVLLFLSEIYKITNFNYYRIKRLFASKFGMLKNNKNNSILNFKKDDHLASLDIRENIDPNNELNRINSNISIKVSSLTKSYHGFQALNNISFEIKRGDFVVMIGPNGSGKSTTINILTSAIEPDSGNISIFDNDINYDDERKGFDDLLQFCGICYQENILIPQLTVYQHLYLFGTLNNIPYSFLKGRISYIYEKLHLSEYANRKASELSGGVKRRLCVAISSISKPPILILDEPTSGVDSNSRKSIWKFLHEETTSLCLISTHYLEETCNYWNKILVLQDGNIAFYGTEGEARYLFKSGYLLKIFGDKSIDLNKLLCSLKENIDDKVIKGSLDNSFILPDNENIENLFDVLNIFNIKNYTLTLQSLEDIINKSLQGSKMTF